MRSLKLALLATAATAVLSSAAFAADLIVDQPSAPPVVDNSFTWDGAYIGAFIQGQSAPAAFGLGVNLGVNALMDNLVLGGEIEKNRLDVRVGEVRRDLRTHDAGA